MAARLEAPHPGAMAGVGLDAAKVQETPKALKHWIGWPPTRSRWTLEAPVLAGRGL